ncbi:15-cis-zeta-carotene isomerase, chloroplastic-like isoform X1 [Andrographis paniculata]|uniref:15-cis-zeta-carotene isomerase, chloroplastic-like isoform X1 n=1 Tax=Andrographis paniculata TaxID=175694 RepID=UPI0021E6FD56|nr:15-cis-zeta-carotene isomerase, chloroplastic-like isoform X1 [Andrographis paniculata]
MAAAAASSMLSCAPFSPPKHNCLSPHLPSTRSSFRPNPNPNPNRGGAGASPLKFNPKFRLRPEKFALHVAESKAEAEAEAGRRPPAGVGEDSAEFVLSEQRISSWLYFGGILGVVLGVLNVAWIDNSTGFGHVYVDALSGGSPEVDLETSEFKLMIVTGYKSLTEEAQVYFYSTNGMTMMCLCRCFPHAQVTMLLLILVFGLVHSGLASLRDVGEKLVGERAFRVLFAAVSLPLAVTTVVYFINHRYDGMQLWQLQGVAGLHQFIWFANFVSFFFLYPSTFNLLEVAAVDKPKMHLWETGIIRITRHPQMVGQVIWCLAHTLWIGNSVAVAASVGLIAHHLFGVWNGDRRLAIRHGEAFEIVKSRTSVVPFAAIFEGRQKLPDDYLKEFLRLPYLAITVLTLGAYFAHPLMQAASFRLHW